MTNIQDPDPLIERETCSRCHGSGHYSYNQLTGTLCFKCSGTKLQRTKRGEAVFRFLREMTETTALDVKVGDIVSYDNHFTGRHRFEIAKIIETAPMSDRQRSVVLVSKGGKQFGFGGGVRLHLAVTEEMRTKARAYRDSLTKAGKPRAIRSKTTATQGETK